MISLMSTLPSLLLSNKSKIRGARATSDDISISLRTSSNSGNVALSPLHLHSSQKQDHNQQPKTENASLNNVSVIPKNSHFLEFHREILELLRLEIVRPHQILELLRPQGEAATQHARHRGCTKLAPRVEALQPRHDLRIHLFLLSQITGHPRVFKNLHYQSFHISLLTNQHFSSYHYKNRS